MASINDIGNISYEDMKESLCKFFTCFARPAILRPDTPINPYHIYLHEDDLKELQHLRIDQLSTSTEVRYIARTYRRLLNEYMEFMVSSSKLFK